MLTYFVMIVTTIEIYFHKHKTKYFLFLEFKKIKTFQALYRHV